MIGYRKKLISKNKGAICMMRNTTEELISAVEDNPVLEGWGNKIVVIRGGR